MFLILLSCSFILNIYASSIIHTSSGKIVGKLIESDFGAFMSYQGIPYAEPPINELRFLAPIPKERWSDVLEATSEGPVCPQPEGVYKYNQMSEDCLFLNINVPFYSLEKKLPVFFFIHGGEFQLLSGNTDKIYGPEMFLMNSIIFISVNYRLGALGFLSLEIPEASGNAGIKDVILALEWVKENIGNFGGDPERITIGGHSAGAVLTHFLTLTDKTTGLFNQAILISGSALGYRFFAKHPKENAIALGEELNLRTGNITELLEDLKIIKFINIIQTQVKMAEGNERNAVRPYAPFVPCKELQNSDAVITENPIDILRKGLTQNVPILAGFNSHEGLKMLPAVTKDQTILKYINNNFELAIPSNIEYPYGSNESRELADSIKEIYFDNNDMDVARYHYLDFVNFITDTQFFYSINSWIDIHKRNEESNVLFYYKLNFDGDLNWFKLKNNVTYPGTSHADELGYLFVTDITKNILSDVDIKTKKAMFIILLFWTNFIKYGNPNSFENPTLWQETRQNLEYLTINEDPTFINSTHAPELYEFWTKVYEAYNSYVENGGEIENKIVP